MSSQSHFHFPNWGLMAPIFIFWLMPCLPTDILTYWDIDSGDFTGSKNQLYNSNSFWHLGIPGHGQVWSITWFVDLIDMTLHAQNRLYTSNSFWDVKVLKSSLGMPGHGVFPSTFHTTIFVFQIEVVKGQRPFLVLKTLRNQHGVCRVL